MPRATSTGSDDVATGFKALEEAVVAIDAMSDGAADAAEAVAQETAHIMADTADTSALGAAEVLGASASHAGAPEPIESGQVFLDTPDELKNSSFLGECMEIAKANVELQKSAFTRLAACRSPVQLLSLQLDLARDTVSGMVAASKRLNEASMREFSQLSARMSAGQ
jgi:hypothetical protein